MYFHGIIALACSALLAFLVAGCQSRPAVISQEPFQIAAVEVTKATSDIGTVNLAEDVRYKAQNEAYRYSEIGQEKVLKVTLTNLHFKNAVTSLLVGDANRMSAKARVVDKASGVVDARFDTTVISKAILNGISGAIISAAQNPIEVEQQMATELASKLLEQIYGNAYARTVGERVPTKTAAPNYPRKYADLKFEHYCASKKPSESTDEFDNTQQVRFTYPEECKKLTAAAR